MPGVFLLLPYPTFRLIISSDSGHDAGDTNESFVLERKALHHTLNRHMYEPEPARHNTVYPLTPQPICPQLEPVWYT